MSAPAPEDKAPENKWTEHRVEMTIGNLLRGGVLTAGLIVLLGAVAYLVRHGGGYPEYAAFHGEPVDLRTVRGIFSQALQGSGRGLIQAGLLVLIATPVARVAFSVIAFLHQHDRLYVVVTLIVLSVLVLSLCGYAR